MYVLISRQARDIVGDFLTNSVSGSMDQYTFSIQTVVTQIEDFANLMFNSESTRTWLSAQDNDRLSEDEKMLANLKMRQFLTLTTANYSVISSVSVFHRNGISIGTQDQVFRDSEFLDAPWYRDFIEHGKQWATVHTDPYQSAALKDVEIISLVFPLGVYVPRMTDSVLKVNFRADLMSKPLEQIGASHNGFFLLMDWNGHPVMETTHPEAIAQIRPLLAEIRHRPDASGMLRMQTDNGPTYLFYRMQKVQDWVLVGLVSEADLYRKLNNLITTMLIMIGVLLVITAITATMLSAGIVKPLTRLSLAMRQIQRGDFRRAEKIALPVARARTEVGFVANSFLSMIEQLRQHIRLEYEMNLRRQGAEYKALLMQINPHFLYNTLEVISSLTMQQRNREAVRVVESLGRMLRFSLDTRNEQVALSEELLYIEHYMSILRLRFADSLHIRIHADAAARKCLVIKFILQPLVENAVKYSTGLDDRTASVEVRCWVDEGEELLHLSVEDNGCGMPEQVIQGFLEEMRRQGTGVLNSSGTQIGLRNVLARGVLYYGDAFQVLIDSRIGEGTRICLSLPSKRKGVESQ